MKFVGSAFLILQVAAYSISYATTPVQVSDPVALVPNPLSPTTFLGWSAAMDGNVSLVASVPDLVGIRNPSGAVHHFDSTTGQQRLRITTSEVMGGDGFGASVDLFESTAIVGTTVGPTNNPDVGAFIFDADNGSLLHKLESPNPAEREFFGTSVAINERWAVVGAPLDDEAAIESGAVYLYDRPNGYQRQKILSPFRLQGERFGFSIAVEGDIAVIGAPEDDREQPASGSAYVLDLISGNSQLLRSPRPNAIGQFGRDVDIDGHYAIVGAVFDNSGFGGAYVYDVDTGTLVSELIPDMPKFRSWFGSSVAIDGNFAIVGAPRDSSFGESAGAAYVFDVLTGRQLAVLSHDEITGGDMFGYAVAIDDGYALVTALEQDIGGVNAVGGAYVFRVVPEPTSVVLSSLSLIITALLYRSHNKIDRTGRSGRHGI